MTCEDFVNIWDIITQGSFALKSGKLQDSFDVRSWDISFNVIYVIVGYPKL